MKEFDLFISLLGTISMFLAFDSLSVSRYIWQSKEEFYCDKIFDFVIIIFWVIWYAFMIYVYWIK